MFTWLKKFFERLAETNKKEFGDKKLDCCDLNTNNTNEEKKQESCH